MDNETMSKPSKFISKLNAIFDKLWFYFILGCGLFMTLASLLGFIGWFSDPSPTKWNALVVGGFCGLITFVWWKYGPPH
jgi:ABC-type dipeptide/oligopeptide/nickel transport system permease subunit